MEENEEVTSDAELFKPEDPRIAMIGHMMGLIINFDQIYMLSAIPGSKGEEEPLFDKWEELKIDAVASAMKIISKNLKDILKDKINDAATNQAT